MTEIRQQLLERDGDRNPTGQAIAEVIVEHDPPSSPRLRIELLPNREPIFVASLEVLAWQMFTLEPRLAQFIV